MTEDEPLDFHSPYGCSKGAADQYVRDYARIYGLKTVVFRQSCIYGTRQFGIEDQGWIAWFCVAATTGKPFTIFGDGKQIRDALWVDDLVDAYLAAVDRIDAVSGQVFNIGGGPSNTLSLRELVAKLEKGYGKKLDPPFADWRPGDQRVFVANIDKAKTMLDWSPEGLARRGGRPPPELGEGQPATLRRPLIDRRKVRGWPAYVLVNMSSSRRRSKRRHAYEDVSMPPADSPAPARHSR